MADIEGFKRKGFAGLAGKGRMSRRDFIQQALAAGLTVAAAETLFTRAVRAEAKRGGLARIGVAHGSTSDSLDPRGYPDVFSQAALFGALSNALTEIDASGNVVGDLAESFEPSDGAKVWAFKLRRGVTFHNGKTVTATDVVESILHHMGETKSAAKSFLKQVAEVKADGPETVLFTLTGGSADFPYIVSDYHLPIMPAKDGGGVDWESGVRTGPFTLGSFEPGVKFQGARNPNYHKANGPWFDEIAFLCMHDVTARTNALTTGEVDYITRADLKTLHLLQRNPEIAINEVTAYVHYNLAMATNVAPFDNNDVRLALKYAIDRQEIVDKVFLGHATVGNDNPLAPSIKYAIDPQPRHVYDPEKVKFHLKQAGLSALKVQLSAADAAFAGAVDVAVLFQQQAAKVGIDIEVLREPNDGYWDNVWLKKPFVAGAWTGRPTADWMLTIGYASTAAWNETFWKNARFDELLTQARAELDEAKRAAQYAEMQQLVHDDCGNIILAFNNLVGAHTTRLAHGQVGSNADLDGMKIAERWWFA